MLAQAIQIRTLTALMRGIGTHQGCSALTCWMVRRRFCPAYFCHAAQLLTARPPTALLLQITTCKPLPRYACFSVVSLAQGGHYKQGTTNSQDQLMDDLHSAGLYWLKHALLLQSSKMMCCRLHLQACSTVPATSPCPQSLVASL